MRFETQISLYDTEAVIRKFESQQTSINAVQGQIDMIISESEMQELISGSTTMYSKLGSLSMDVEGLSGQFSVMEGQYDTLSGRYTTLDAKVAQYKAGVDGLSANLTTVTQRLNENYSTTTEMQSAINASAAGITAAVSSTYATQSALGSATTRLDALETWRSSAELKITDSAIISTVTQSSELSLAMQSEISQQADAIRLKASTIAWTAANSSMTETGVLICTGATINGDLHMVGESMACSIGNSQTLDWNTIEGIRRITVENFHYETVNSNGDRLDARTWRRSSNYFQETIATTTPSIRTISVIANNYTSVDDIRSGTCPYKIDEFTANGYSCIISRPSSTSFTFSLMNNIIELKSYGSVTVSSSRTYIGHSTPGYMEIKDGSTIKCSGGASLSGSSTGASIHGGNGAYVEAAAAYLKAVSGDSGCQLYILQNGQCKVSQSEILIGSSDTSSMCLHSSSLNYIYWGSRALAFASSSSRRYKHSIGRIKDKGLDPKKLYELPVVQFEYNKGATLQYADMEGFTIPGFIAEDVEKVYPAAVIHDEEGHVESWDERRIIPGMLALIQEQKKQIDDLNKTVADLQRAIA